MKTDRGDDTKRARDGLAYLLSHGADPLAVDDSNESVSETAYFNMKDETSRAGDVWDAVLVDFGFAITDFRRRCPRKASYRPFYTRRDFEELWTGREHLCPYYYDEEVYEEVWTTDEESNQDDGDALDDSSDSDEGGGGML